MVKVYYFCGIKNLIKYKMNSVINKGLVLAYGSGCNGRHWTFLSNHVIVLLLAINLTVIASASCPYADEQAIGLSLHETVLCRQRRSYDKTPGQGAPAVPGIKQDPAPPGNAIQTKPVPSGSRSAVFSTENSTVVVAQVGGTAALPCIVRKFSNGVVSWLRKDADPPSLLTVGLTTYSADDRLIVEHVRHLQNWGLLIKHVLPSDEGLYECQVSTHPPTSIFLRLKVTKASAEIIGSPDLHLHAGSTLQLVCTLRQSTEQPQYVFWYHDAHMINYDQGVEVIPNRASSILRVQDADRSHTGNYTCSPSNAIPASINVHVLNATEEENPAAMLHNMNYSPHSGQSYICIIIAFGVLNLHSLISGIFNLLNQR